MRPSPPRVVVVGGGISGLSCARTLQEGGARVVVLDRGRRLGGRMARWTREGRAVDVGAAYCTVSAPAFADVVADWQHRGLARKWTSVLGVAEGEVAMQAWASTPVGPTRWAAPQGLRSLAEDLGSGLELRSEHVVRSVSAGVGDGPPRVDGEPFDAVVLAMPDPQAADLVADGARPQISSSWTTRQEWDPDVVVVTRWPSRSWPDFDAVFVNGSARLELLVDDGRRRGDGAPVLVARTGAELARRHLADPDAAIPEVLAAIRAMLGIDEEPRWAQAKRWTLASPRRTHDTEFLLGEDLVGSCGDAHSSRPRVEGAFLSGRALGERLLAVLR